jgi:hypothetical protein
MIEEDIQGAFLEEHALYVAVMLPAFEIKNKAFIFMRLADQEWSFYFNLI